MWERRFWRSAPAQHGPRWTQSVRCACPRRSVGTRKGFDLGSAHLRQVAHAVEVEIAFDPADAGLLGAIGGVFGADGVTELIQQLLGAVLFHGLTPPFDKERFRV